MPSRPILVDVTRLLTRLRHRHPSGIDRVDLAYARRFLTGATDRRAVAITPFGPRLVPPDDARRLLSTIEERWSETLPAAADPVLRRVRARLAGEPTESVESAPSRTGPGLRRLADRVASLVALRWDRAEAAPRDAIYLHTSHLRLDRPGRFDWLSARRDVRAVFFVHDLIPIEFPEYAVPGEAERHRVRMETAARHGAAILVNSRDVRSRLGAFLAGQGLPAPPIHPAWLGVEPAFLGQARPAPAGSGRPYFVVCSTVEARKNHLLLLQVWRELAGRHGPDTPALVIVGRRGWESESAVDLLDRCPAIRGHVIEAGGLSTAGLVELLLGARALLMPSFAEGYGIPVVEALSLGTPVVASDIPAHREIAAGHATLLDPLDGPGWLAAIEAPSHRHPEVAPYRRDAQPYRPPTWGAHFQEVDRVLDGL